jgi:hypothetical protein
VPGTATRTRYAADTDGMKETHMQYFVLLIDYAGRIGMGADVRTEMTRGQLRDEVRDILAADDNRSIVHIKFVDGNSIEDITEEVVAEAKADLPGKFITFADLQAARFDHARDLAKHEAVS